MGTAARMTRVRAAAKNGSKWSRMVCADGTGTRPDYLVNHVDQQIDGHLQKDWTKIEK